MTFTQEEEDDLRLILNEWRARQLKNKVDVEMGTAIRAQFSTIDSQIRAQYKTQTDALQADVVKAQDNIKARFA